MALRDSPSKRRLPAKTLEFCWAVFMVISFTTSEGNRFYCFIVPSMTTTALKCFYRKKCVFIVSLPPQWGQALLPLWFPAQEQQRTLSVCLQAILMGPSERSSLFWLYRLYFLLFFFLPLSLASLSLFFISHLLTTLSKVPRALALLSLSLSLSLYLSLFLCSLKSKGRNTQSWRRLLSLKRIRGKGRLNRCFKRNFICVHRKKIE